MQHHYRLILFLLLSSLTLFLTACSSSTGPGGDDDEVMSYYFPLSKGSTWSYEGLNTSTSIREKDTTINGREYVVSISSGLSESYFRREGTTIYQFDRELETEFPYLKEESAGTTWTHGLDSSSTTRELYTVVGYDSTRIVGGKRYHDILHLQVRIQSNPGFGWVTFMTSHYYFARGIGLIEVKNPGLGGTLDLKIISFDVTGSTATAEATTDQQKDPGDDSHVHAKVNGEEWDFSVVTATDFSGITIVSAVANDATDGKGLSIMFDRKSPGTYRVQSVGFLYPLFSLIRSTTNETSIAGELVITASDGQTIEGTFWFSGSEGSEVEDGSFRVFID